MTRFHGFALAVFPFAAILFAGCSSTSPSLNGTPPPPPGPSSIDVVTHHYDSQRSGQNLKETTLTTSNVNSATFGKVGEFSIDGQIDGQALFLGQLAIPGQGNKDVLYVATENDTVYAVDAQSISGSALESLRPQACRAETLAQMESPQRRSSTAAATPSMSKPCPRTPRETSFTESML